MTERNAPDDRPDDGDADEPKVIHLHGRDFAGASFAANELEQTEDQRDPNAEADIDNARNSIPNVQDRGLSS